MTDVCFSGGAKGADHAWGLMAANAGHQLIHFTFAGHNAVEPQYAQMLSRLELEEADASLAKANISMKRRWPGSNNHVNDLLRRNYFQIRYAERVYAVANRIEDKTLLGISGGTSWACQMYVDRWYSERNFVECELYLFDMFSDTWMQWTEEWRDIAAPPVPHGRYAAIGSRDISDAGVEAIFRAYG